MMGTDRCVRFDALVVVTETPISLEVYDQDIADSIWYSSDEMNRIQKRALFDIQLNEEAALNYCIDVKTYQEDRSIRKQEVISNVLLQQELLWDDNIDDPELIAEVYAEDTEISQLEATQRGIRHEEHVKDISEMNTLMLSTISSPINEHDTLLNCKKQIEIQNDDEQEKDVSDRIDVSINEDATHEPQNITIQATLELQSDQTILPNEEIRQPELLLNSNMGDTSSKRFENKQTPKAFYTESIDLKMLQFTNSSSILSGCNNYCLTSAITFTSVITLKERIAPSQGTARFDQRRHLIPRIKSSSRVWDRGRQ